jgi:hypothetical protein
MTMGVDRLVIRDLDGLRDFALRLEMVGSSEIKCSPLGDELGSVSCVSVASKDPCWSSLHLSGGRGGSKLINGRPRSLCDWQSFSSSMV